MAKKTAHTRSVTQRNKPKTQKSIELVRQTSTEKEIESESGPEKESNGVAISTATTSENEKGGTKLQHLNQALLPALQLVVKQRRKRNVHR